MSQIRAYAMLTDPLGNVDSHGHMTMQILVGGSQPGGQPTIVRTGTDGSLIDPIDGMNGVNMVANATYRVRRGNGPPGLTSPWRVVTTPTAGSLTLGPIVGQDPYP